MLTEDKKHLENVTALVTDPDGQRELLQQDEEEDFLDEGTQFVHNWIYNIGRRNKVNFRL